MQFTAEIMLPASPEQVWAMVTEPTLIERWASLPVRALRTGHDNHATGLGASRAVALPLGLAAIEQVVARCEPPRCFAYRTVSALPAVRSYSGTISLTRTDAGTQLTWALDLTLSHAVGRLEPILRALLTMGMRSDLTALKDLLAAAPPAPVVALPSAASPHAEDLAAALAETRHIADEQRALAQALRASGDPKHFYVQLCYLTTQEMLVLSESGQLPHPSWALRILSLLHAQFLQNLRRWLSPNLGSADPQWEVAFQAFDVAGQVTAIYSVLTGLHLALRAQLEHDLPQAVAQTLRGGGAGDCARFRADLYATSLALRLAVERLLTETITPHLPPWLARSGARLLGETLELLLQRYVYDVVGQRARAFERGVQLAEQPLRRRPLLGQSTARAQLVLAQPPAPYGKMALVQATGATADRAPEAGILGCLTSRKKDACGTAPGSAADAA